MLIESKLILTKSFPRGVSKVSFGNYEISPVSYFSSTEIEALLSFSHNSNNNGDIAHPEEEVDIICKLLSVFLNARIRKLSTAADENNIPVFDGRERLQYPQFFGYLDPEEADDLINRTLTLDEDLARQFIRACRCYSYALEQLPSDPAFALFMLVTAANCMSSRDEVVPSADTDPEENHAERLSRFIRDYLSDVLKEKGVMNEELLVELLENAFYYHRSAFVHDGKAIASASSDADRTGVEFSITVVNGKEVKMPGLAWLSGVVRGALVGYLKALVPPSEDSMNQQLFSNIALEKAKLKT